MSDTIYALSSAAGKAGVSVVRVSGPHAFASLGKLAPHKKITARQAIFTALRNPAEGEVIDHALVVPFKGPASFTGEDIVEYHLHGSPAVLSSLLSALSSFDGHRPAEPGEYTRRAFENGKLDLTAAEAVADLINAETEIQRRQALTQMDGALSSLYEGWRERLIRVMAYIEAVIDFPDEDVPDSQVQTMMPELRSLRSDISHHLNDNRRGERLRDGIHVVIAGAPNAGKSSLLNLLMKRDVAIVSSVAGTTRDVIEAHLDLGGYPVILADTAGLRDADLSDDHGSIESEGIRRAKLRADQADLLILLFDGTAEPDAQTLSLKSEKSLAVRNKSDEPGFRADEDCLSLSVKTGDGVDAFLATLTDKIRALYSVSRETPSLTRARHRSALEECVQNIDTALEGSSPELIAEDVRMAARALGRITGRVDVEDLLDVIFRDFCIGK